MKDTDGVKDHQGGQVLADLVEEVQLLVNRCVRRLNEDQIGSQSAVSIIEPSRVSRREVDKVGERHKHQNLEVWPSDAVESVCFAANDGHRAAWEAWSWPALQPQR